MWSMRWWLPPTASPVDGCHPETRPGRRRPTSFTGARLGHAYTSVTTLTGISRRDVGQSDEASRLPHGLADSIRTLPRELEARYTAGTPRVLRHTLRSVSFACPSGILSVFRETHSTGQSASSDRDWLCPQAKSRRRLPRSRIGSPG